MGSRVPDLRRHDGAWRSGTGVTMTDEADATGLEAWAKLRHELRQPLQALRLLHGALCRAVSDPAVLAMLESQQEAIDALEQCIDALPGGTQNVPAAASAAAPAHNGSEPAGDFVVVVEDDAQVRKAWERLLGAEGYRVACLGTLAELGGALANGAVPALVITDHRLRDGADAAQVVRAVRAATGRTVPALVVTGEPEAATEALALLENCRVAAKPLRPAALLEMVRAARGA
jgi:CheY-like chemotaxis protein